jgi:electron transport complex protein RnfB
MSHTREEVAEAVDSYAARTVPVHVSVQATQVVLSQPEMQALLAGAQCICLTDCECRFEQRKCDAPVDVCLSLNESARKLIAEGRARPISLSEALDRLRRSHRAGLVHLAYRREESEATEEVCSCCSCCCWFLNALKRFDYHDALAESAYVAAFDAASCDGCGVCLQRCHFQAWERVIGAVHFHPGRCFGCGLCVSTCPVGAISFVKRTAHVP